MKLPDLARNMHRFFTATTILLILFWSSLTFGQVFSPDETISRIADNLMCTCGCPHIIGQCGDECSVAPQLVHEISQLYGLRVHAAPKAEGFNLLAWVMPFVGLLAGMVVVFIVVNRLKPDESSQEADRVRPEIDEKYRKLIDRELER
jgi:cytochrome c-type biogenesis protein CcmH